MNIAGHGTVMEILRNRIDVKVASNENNYLKWTSKPNHMSQKRFDNNLNVISKNK